MIDMENKIDNTENPQHDAKLPVSGSLPSADDLKPFLYWVFHKADRIWVEHTLGWRENAIEEMYEAYLRRKQ